MLGKGTLQEAARLFCYWREKPLEARIGQSKKVEKFRIFADIDIYS
jgi:hypothetical protein